MKDCVFCKIVKGEIPADFERKGKNVVVFADINPSAQVHLLIVPKKHIPDFASLSADDKEIWDEVVKVAHELIARHGLSTKGYRLVTNGGPAAMIHHFHLHLLGGVSANVSV